MSLEYEMSLEDKMLRVTAHGSSFTLDDVKKYLRSIIMTAMEKQAEMLLVDERGLTHHLSVVDTYELAKAVTKYAPRVGKAALVFSPEDFPNESFYETVLANRGVRVKITSDISEALEWLQNS